MNRYNAIPPVLKSRNQWITWRLIGNGNKIPDCKTNEPSTWGTFDSVEGKEKIAYVISRDDPFTGIDLDNCLGESGNYREWALPIIEKFRGVSYCEVSPSGTGVKLVTIGKKLTNSKCVHVFLKSVDGGKAQQVECYDNGRFWAITGRCMGEGFQEIGNGQSAVEWLCNTYLMQRPSQQAAASQQTHSHSDFELQASKYLAKIDGAVSGQCGHIQLLKAAIALVKGFALPTDVAYRMLLNEYNERCQPPWSERELQHKADEADKLPDEKERGWLRKSSIAVASRSRMPVPTIQNGDDSPYDEITDNSLATRFIDAYGKDLKYVVEWKKWLKWDGRRWSVDSSGVCVLELARKFSNSLWQEFLVLAQDPTVSRDELSRHRAAVRGANKNYTIDSIVHLATADPRVTISFKELNKHGLLLNCLNGTIDLVTGKLLHHSRDNLITQIAGVEYHPDAQCPKWLETLSMICDDDSELLDYVQRLLGYSIAANAGEAILPIVYGDGNNGKSTVWNTVCDVLGDYGDVACDTLLIGEKDNHPNEKADLYEKRFVAISEPERAAKLKESRVKELTGDKFIKARRLYEEFWTFRRSHTFWLSTNHLPRIQGTDDAIWRRVKLIPFKVNLSNKVKTILNFSDWLVRNEGPGILAWFLEGFRSWQVHGLEEPRVVKEATAKFRADSDVLGEWIAEYCLVEDGAMATAKELFFEYEKSGGKLSKTSFGMAMAERFERDKPKSGKYRDKAIYYGVRLKCTQNEEVQKFRENMQMGPVGTSLAGVTYGLPNSIESLPKLVPASPNVHEVAGQLTTKDGCGVGTTIVEALWGYATGLIGVLSRSADLACPNCSAGQIAMPISSRVLEL